MRATTSSRTPRAAGLLADAGILESPVDVPEHLRLFIDQADRVLAEVHELETGGEMDSDTCAAFRRLLAQACARVLCHPVVASNLYLRRFAQGVKFSQARHELQQFSV